MSEPVARIDRLTFSYPGSSSAALRDETWDIDAGTLSVLIGRSGSGKSSLLRSLNGLVPHFSGGSFGGSVVVDDVDTRTVPPRDLGQRVGFVFQDPEAQMLTDRVESDIAFGLEQAGVDRVIMRARVDWAMAATGITALAARRPSMLSGGEQQRVAIAAAIAVRPALLVLDEPTSQLDPEGAGQIMDAIAHLGHEHGMSVVVAEHRLEHLLGIADALKVLGDRPHSGSPGDVVERMDPIPLPAVTRLARSIGAKPIPLDLEEARETFQGLILPHRQLEAPSTSGDVLARVAAIDVTLARRTVLDGVDVDVREGELVALMGHNGSGKTTLLRAIAGLVPVTRGEVRTLGLDMRRNHPSGFGGKVGYVPQQATAIFSKERLADEFQGGVAPPSVLGDFDLRGFEDRHPMDLSGGERERAALAVTMARSPRLLLLDEPTRGMDAWRKRDLAQLLTNLRRTGIGILLASHDVDLIASCATRIVVLDDGRVVADGSPAVVLPGHPAIAPQVNQVFGNGWLTDDEVVAALPPSRVKRAG